MPCVEKVILLPCYNLTVVYPIFGKLSSISLATPTPFLNQEIT